MYINLVGILLTWLGSWSALAATEARSPSGPDLDGVWKVVSAVDHTEGVDTVRYPWSEHPIGLVIIQSGYISIQIMSPEAPPPLREDMTAAEAKATLDRTRASYIAYFGAFTVDPEERSLTIKVDGGWRHDYAGTVQKRFYEIDGDRLVIGPAPNVVNGKRVERKVTMVRSR